MQQKKISTKRQILDMARMEFEEKGFYHTKIRDIALKSGSSIGNIYVYFENKDGLFMEVAKPTVDRLEVLLKTYENLDPFEDTDRWGLEWHEEFVVLAAEFVDMNRKNLKLLYFHSQGSKLENFREMFIDRSTEINIKMIQKVKERFPEYNITVSDFFMHNYISFLVNMVGEILMHDISLEKMLYYFREFITFEHYGFKPLMGDYAFIPLPRKQ